MPSRKNLRAGRGWEVAVAVIAALAAGAAGGYLIATRSSGPSTTSAAQPPAKPDRVTALGRLQPATGVVPIYGPTADRIAKLYPLAPGTLLKEGDPIAELESATDRRQEVQVARTQLEEATKARDAAKRAGEQKILAAKAELNQAQANKASDLAAIDARISYLKLGV